MKRGLFLFLSIIALGCAGREGLPRDGSIVRPVESGLRKSFFTDWENLTTYCAPWVVKNGAPDLTPEHWNAVWRALDIDPRADKLNSHQRGEISRQAFEVPRQDIRPWLRTTGIKSGAGVLGRMLSLYGNAPGYEVRHLEAIRSRILREPIQGGPCTTAYLSLLYGNLLHEIDPFFTSRPSKAASTDDSAPVTIATPSPLLYWRVEARSFGDSLVVTAISKEAAASFTPDEDEPFKGVGTAAELGALLSNLPEGDELRRSIFWIFDLRGWSDVDFAPLKAAFESILPPTAYTRMPWLVLWRSTEDKVLLAGFESLGNHWRLLQARGVCTMEAPQLAEAGLPEGITWQWGCQDDLKLYPMIGGKRNRKIISGNLPPDAREFISARLAGEGSVAR